MAEKHNRVTVDEHTFRCDRCGLAVTLTESLVPEEGPDNAYLPPHWRRFGNVVRTSDPDLTFHTKRCAIGYFRDAVEQAWAD